MKSRLIAIIVGVMLFVVLALQNTAVFALEPTINNQSVSIPENATNGSSTTPSQIVASDPEQGSNNLTFLVTGGTGQSMFNVSSSGSITYNGSGTLDYESATKSYTLVVQVTDTQALSASATVTVNVSNVADVDPVIDDQGFLVPENSANNTTVGTIAVTDPENDAHIFNVTGGTGTGIFSVDASSGQIKVTNSSALDFETPPNSYTLEVTVKDVGSNNTDSATMTIDVTNVNEPPTIPNYPFSVSEAASNGTVVGTVTGVDPEGLAVSYAIVGSTPFAVNSSTGQITVANANQLDFETQPQIVITVKASDPASNFANSTVTITVTNENDAPQTSGIPDVVVNEGAAPTNINLRLYFSDAEDTPAALDYAVQNNSNGSLFSSVAIDGSDVLKLTYNSNASGISNITIRATDTGGKFVDSTFKVDINDAPTTSGIADFSVNEDASNTSIDLYTVFDDAEDSDSALTYAIVSNSNNGLFSPPVAISSQRYLVLDYAANANGNSTIKVKATDTGGLSVETQFKVTVIPGKRRTHHDGYQRCAGD